MQYQVTFYEAKFHTIMVDADNPNNAEVIATDYVRKFPGTAKAHSRGLVRWSVDPASEGV